MKTRPLQVEDLKISLGRVHQLARDADTSAVLNQLWDLEGKWGTCEQLDHLYSRSRSDFVLLARELYHHLVSLKFLLTERYAIRKNALDVFVYELDHIVAKMLQTSDLKLVERLGFLFAKWASQAGTHYFPVGDRRIREEVREGPLYISIAEPGEHFIVSHGLLRDYLIYFDAWTEKQPDAEWIINRFVSEVKKIEKDIGRVDALCFIEKSLGARGPIVVQRQIAERLPGKAILNYATVCDEAVLVEDFSTIVRQPRRTDITLACILYDLILTGSGVSRSSAAISREFSANSLAILLHREPNEFKPPESLKQVRTFFPHETVKEVVSGHLRRSSNSLSRMTADVAEPRQDDPVGRPNFFKALWETVIYAVKGPHETFFTEDAKPEARRIIERYIRGGSNEIFVFCSYSDPFYGYETFLDAVETFASRVGPGKAKLAIPELRFGESRRYSRMFDLSTDGIIGLYEITDGCKLNFICVDDDMLYLEEHTLGTRYLCYLVEGDKALVSKYKSFFDSHSKPKKTEVATR